MTFNRSKLVYSLVAVLISVAAFSGTLDSVAESHAEKAFARALATFAVARTLNGAISVAQGTEIALEPGGVGVMLTPGQVLDPVNDLVERFSSVMLVAASSLGMQLVLLDAVSWWVLSALLVATLVTWLYLAWGRPDDSERPRQLLARVALILVVLRFAVPVVVIGTELFFDAFLETEHETATLELGSSTDSIREISASIDAEPGAEQTGGANAPEAADSDEPWVFDDVAELAARIQASADSMLESAGEWFDSVDLTSSIDELQARAANITEHIVHLIVIFVLQTIILPVAMLWVFVEVLKRIAGRAISYATDRGLGAET